MLQTFSVVCCHPLDVARSRIASSTGAKRGTYTGTIDCLTKIYQAEGIKGWYSGLSVAVIVLFRFSRAIGVCSDERNQLCFLRTREATLRAHLCAPSFGVVILLWCNFWSNLYDGSCSLIISFLVVYPFDVIKCQMMNSGKNESALACARRIVGTKGVRGLYKGWDLALAKVVPTTSVNFLSYEFLKTVFQV